MGWNPVKEAEKKAKKAIDKIINPAVDAGKKVVYDGSVWARDAVRKVQREAEDGVRKVGREVEDNAKKALHDAEDGAISAIREAETGLTEKLPDLIEDAVKDLAEEASERSIKEALDNACDVIEVMAPSRFSLIFGVELALVVQGEVTVSVGMPNPTAKLTQMRRWADAPPSGRAQIIECIKDFGPDSLGVEFKVSGNGLSAEWDGDDKYDRIDAFLAKHGID